MALPNVRVIATAEEEQPARRQSAGGAQRQPAGAERQRHRLRRGRPEVVDSVAKAAEASARHFPL